MPKGLALLILLIIAVALPARADMPSATLFAAEITTGASAIKGYIVVSEYTQVNVDKPDILRQLKESSRESIEFFSELVFVSHPYGMLVSIGELSGSIKLSEIRRIRKIRGEYNGRHFTNEIPKITRRTAQLLQNDPFYICTPRYAESGEYWLSYNKAVGEKELGPICMIGHPLPPDAKEFQSILKYPDVVHLSFGEN